MSGQMGTVSDTLGELARSHPEIDAVVGPEGHATYRELDQRVREVAQLLVTNGIGRGSRVALLLGNGLRWVVTAIAVQSLGAVVAPVSTWAREVELTTLRRQLRPAMLITATRVVGRDPSRELALAGFSKHDWTDEATSTHPRVVLWESDDPLPQLATSTTETALPAPAPHDTALILSTSGSTSQPKLVPLRQDRLLANGRAIGERQRLEPGDRLWLGAPLFFSYGCANALPVCLTHAATLVLQEGLDGDEALNLIEQEQCTVYYGFGPTTRKLLAAPSFNRIALSTLRTGTTGFTVEEKRLALDGLGIRNICSVYGLTEAYGHSAMTEAGDSEGVYLNTQGLPLPTQELRIMDLQTGENARPGMAGEIQLRGAVTDGYLDDTSDSFTADGWFRTGDVGALDQDGRLQYLDRTKSILKINGINLAPAEIEDLILQHESVSQAFVYGEYVEGQQRVVAVVVPAPAVTVDTGALSAHIRDNAASYKTPSRYILVDGSQVPTTDTGKVNKRKLGEQLCLATTPV